MTTVSILILAALVYIRWGRGRPWTPAEKLRQAFHQRPGAPEGMRYVHDCEACTPLDRIGEYDVYICPQSGWPTVVARYGDDGPEYLSSSQLKLYVEDKVYAFDVSGDAVNIKAKVAVGQIAI